MEPHSLLGLETILDVAGLPCWKRPLRPAPLPSNTAAILCTSDNQSLDHINQSINQLRYIFVYFIYLYFYLLYCVYLIFSLSTNQSINQSINQSRHAKRPSFQSLNPLGILDDLHIVHVTIIICLIQNLSLW